MPKDSITLEVPLQPSSDTGADDQRGRDAHCKEDLHGRLCDEDPGLHSLRVNLRNARDEVICKGEEDGGHEKCNEEGHRVMH